MKKIVIIGTMAILMGLCGGILKTGGGFAAEPPDRQFNCFVQKLTSDFIPKRHSDSPAWIEYRGSGLCVQVSSDIPIAWESRASYFDDGWTVEYISRDLWGVGHKLGAVRHRCSQDPWLTAKACTLNDASPERQSKLNMHLMNYMINPPIIASARPFSAALLSSAQLTALNQQQQASRVSQAWQPARTKQGTAAIYVDKANAPIIMSPQPNTRITSSSFKIQITPSQNLGGTHILVQFTKVDGPANQLKPTYTWTRLTSALANGAYLPTDIVNSAGNWTLRARIDAPKPGDFSAEVPFTYAPAIATTPRTGFDIYKR